MWRRTIQNVKNPIFLSKFNEKPNLQGKSTSLKRSVKRKNKKAVVNTRNHLSICGCLSLPPSNGTGSGKPFFIKMVEIVITTMWVISQTSGSESFCFCRVIVFPRIKKQYTLNQTTINAYKKLWENKIISNSLITAKVLWHASD